MKNDIQQMNSVGVIARRLGVPLHRIQYVIRSRKIQPTGTAGNVRVFSEADVSRIAVTLRNAGQTTTE